MFNDYSTENVLVSELCAMYGVQTSYYDVNGRKQRASIESLISILKALGAPVETINDVPSAWRKTREDKWQRPAEPVIITWDNEPVKVELRLPSNLDVTRLSYHLKLESGLERRGKWHDGDTALIGSEEIEGIKYVVRRVFLPGDLPSGYHRLILELSGKYEESLIISAPRKAYDPQRQPDKGMWGVFLPLYALRTEKNWGSGNYSDLGKLMVWVGGLGGQVVATLPLLAPVISGDVDFSPYRPSTRLLWNEFYLDIHRVPELADCSSAKTLISSTPFQTKIEALRNLPLVDYKGQMLLKRKVLEELSACLFSKESRRLEDFRTFTTENLIVEDYARFLAVCEKQNGPWRSWPQPLREGVITEGDYEEKNKQYHLYVQWLAQQQMTAVSETAREKGLRLYLDLPVGVHPDGYDVWCEAGSFVRNVQVGAPPDTVFTRGQNWEFPPLHSQRIREQGYRYVISYLRHNLKHSGILRIDHVMGLHRLFCIPPGMESSQGVYLNYHAEELYAILTLESHRNNTIIVGEDLGIVPDYVRPAMKEHGINSMYILRYELADDIREGIHPVPSETVASMNTHDMPPFASFWEGLDTEERLSLGLLDEAGAQAERVELPDIKKALTGYLRSKGWLGESEEDVLSVLKACLAFLAAGDSRAVLVNLEDLWLETKPQNVPSTRAEYPNWQRKMRFLFEEFSMMPQVNEIIKEVDRLRREGSGNKNKNE